MAPYVGLTSGRRVFAAVAAVVLVGFFAAFYRIGAESIWYDEAVTISYARIDLARAIEAVIGRDTNGSLYYLLIRAWVAVFGHGEGHVRAFSAICAIAALPFVVGIGLRMDRPWVGVGAALLLAGSYMFTAYAREARMYSLVMLVSVAATYILMVLVDRSRVRWMVVYGVVAGLGVYVHIFMIPIIAAHGAWLLQRAIRFPDPRLRRQAVVALGTAAVISAPLVPFLLLGDTTAWISPLSSDTLTWTFLALAGSSPWMLAIAALSLTLAIALWARERPRSDDMLLVLLCALAPIVLGVAVSLVRPALVPRYFIVAMPAICLAVTYAASRIRPAWLAVAAFAIVLAIDVATAVAWHQGGQKDDWRQVAQRVASWAGPDDQVAFYVPGSALPFDYYVERLGLGSDVPAQLDTEALGACPACAAPPRIWLVLNYQWTGQTPPQLAALMDRLESAGYRGRGRDREVGGVKIRMMVRAEGGGR